VSVRPARSRSRGWDTAGCGRAIRLQPASIRRRGVRAADRGCPSSSSRGPPGRAAVPAGSLRETKISPRAHLAVDTEEDRDTFVVSGSARRARGRSDPAPHSPGTGEVRRPSSFSPGSRRCARQRAANTSRPAPVQAARLAARRRRRDAMLPTDSTYSRLRTRTRSPLITRRGCAREPAVSRTADPLRWTARRSVRPSLWCPCRPPRGAELVAVVVA